MKKYEQVKAAVVGLVLSSAVIPVAMAEDIEIYRSDTSVINPNILFILDNSGSMEARSWVKPYYDPSRAYIGDCQRDGIYFSKLEGKPDCSASPDNYFNRSALVCDNAKYLYRADGVKESPIVELGLQLFGTYSDQFARRDDSINKSLRWEALDGAAPRDYLVECLADSGLHGPGGGSSHYMVDETGGNSDGYTSTAPVNLEAPHPVWNAGAGHRILWDGNYLNYLTAPWVNNPDNFINPTRLEQVQRAVLIMASTNNRVNVGLMALDENAAAAGGAVQYAMNDIVSTRNDLKARVETLTPTASTTLSETYYEALLYYGGKDIDYGDDASPVMHGEAKRLGNLNFKYRSPISSTCGVNYIVVLSDGTPTNDDANTQNGTVDRFDALPGMSKLTCNTAPTLYDFAVDGFDISKTEDDNPEPGADQIDNCLDELAEWAFTEDVATDDANPLHNGDQHIRTHTIGFALDLADADDIAADALLRSTAEMGGGKYRRAVDGEDLVDIFQDLIALSLGVNTTFSSPAVSVNAFNRSTHLDDLYFTMFKPHPTDNAWPGNLKKYKLAFDADDVPFIADESGAAAVNAGTGLFETTAKSFWSEAVDGADVEKGGTASKLTHTRNVYTITGDMTDLDSNGVYQPANGNLTGEPNKVAETNNALTDALLGIVGIQPLLEEIPYRQTMIDWAAGLDVFNKYGRVDTRGDARLNMGDPLHAEPALVQYGQTTTTVDEVTTVTPDLVAYVATNDGYLHAFNVSDGSEIFSFIPQELLTALPAIMENNGGEKAYGLDGSVIAWVDDANNDGVIEEGTDRVILYFGMRRGGKNIYAVDVTTRTAPELLWVIKGGSVGDYLELGQTWSTINIEKIKIGAAVDGTEDKTVLVFGGGYDVTQDNALVRRPDGMGRTVFIADAETGARLWSARDNVTGLDTAMQYSIPARVTTADMSGDGYTDRIYASDMGGQIFRFDINNTRTRAATLSASISGARIADLAGAAAEDARRFYYPLDVALIDAAPDGNYHALVTSSGFRAHPLNTEIHDRIYMIKDRHTGLLTSSADYNYNPTTPDAAGVLTESHLKDATLNLAGGDSATDGDREAELALIRAQAGWYIKLDDEASPGTWIGEKGLAEPLIIGGVAIITTYTPTVPEAGSCVPPGGTGKVFYLDVVDATPEPPNKTVTDSDVRNERHVVLSRGGIPPSPNVIITKDGAAGCVGTECDVVNVGIGIRKTYWYEVEK